MVPSLATIGSKSRPMKEVEKEGKKKKRERRKDKEFHLFTCCVGAHASEL